MKTGVAAGQTSGQKHNQTAYQEGQKEPGGERRLTPSESSQNSAGHRGKLTLKLNDEITEYGVAAGQTSWQNHPTRCMQRVRGNPRHRAPSCLKAHAKMLFTALKPLEKACGAMTPSEIPQTKIGGNDSTQQTNDFHTYNTLETEADGQHEYCTRKNASNGEKGGKPVNANYWPHPANQNHFAKGNSRFQNPSHGFKIIGIGCWKFQSAHTTLQGKCIMFHQSTATLICTGL